MHGSSVCFCTPLGAVDFIFIFMDGTCGVVAGVFLYFSSAVFARALGGRGGVGGGGDAGRGGEGWRGVIAALERRAWESGGGRVYVLASGDGVAI